MTVMLRQCKLTVEEANDEDDPMEVILLDPTTGEPSAINTVTKKRSSATLKFSKDTTVPNEEILTSPIGGLPEWVKSLQRYFQFIKLNDNKRKDAEMICLNCKKSVTANGTFNFIRHLQRSHPDLYDIYVQNLSKGVQSEDRQGQMKETKISFPVKGRKIQIPPYSKADPKQKGFEENLARFILLDSMPFSIVEKRGFQNLIQFLDPKLQIPTRATIMRRIAREYQQASDKIKLTLSKLPLSSCHLIADIWSTRQKESVLGIQGRYITKNWKLCHEVLGFKAFSEDHSSKNLRQSVLQFLYEAYGLGQNKIASITIDNAANTLAAFRMVNSTKSPPPELEGDRDTQSDSEPEADDDDGETFPEYCGDEIMESRLDVDEESSEWEDIVEVSIDEPEVTTNWMEWLGLDVIANGCLAHLLQLAIKDGIKASPVAGQIIKKVNDIVKFFHKSTKWNSRLRKKTSGLCLIKPCATRWSSTFQCLRRISSDEDYKDRPDIILNLNEVLGVARKEAKGAKKKRIPQNLEEDAAGCVNIIRDLLKPFAELTNDLQADGVTSSLVIMGLINAIKRCQAVEIDETASEFEELVKFQSLLINSAVLRFTTEQGKARTKEGKKQNIVTVDIFQDQNYILATLLDPRIKTTPFKRTTTVSPVLAGKLPTEDEVINILRERMLLELSKGSFEVSGSEANSQEITEMPAAKKKKSSSMFSLVEEIVQETSLASSAGQHTGEIEDYLKYPMQPGEDSPLEFWQLNEKKFPVLAALAKFYLAIPATSGSVERLFSVAGAIARSRRARIKIALLEKVLTVRQYLLNALM